MKTLLKPLIVIVLLIGIQHNQAIAQTATSNEMAASSNDTDNNNNDYSKWGLLGLLGLVGLLKLRKTDDRTTTYSTANNPQNR